MYFWYVDGNNSDRLIWQTKNGGTSWTQINDDGITNCGDLLGGCGTEQGGYNLELAAVPDGQVTDLYAGAVNLYKCRITTASPSCNGSAPDTFINLTHAFGCPPNFGSIAHVHPYQHAMAFLQTNGNTRVVMYFANDGGIYRALDGYTGLLTGTCGGSNQFDSLNQTLGSITQFISFSQHPTDPNTLLGGAENNGSPATSTSQSNPSWVNVNAGDGGYNQINPDNPTEWFTANTDVSIERCALGVDCRAQDFSSGLVVSNATVGGDSGPFFTPFILDPQNSGELLVGTCRVWRGATDGSGFSVLTNNLETGGSESCTGSEVNLVRALAAGGIKDTAGFSNVMYAGNRWPRPARLYRRPHLGRDQRQRRCGRVDRPHGNHQPFRIPDLGSRHRPIRLHRPHRLHDHHGISRLSRVEDHRRRRILDRLQPGFARRARQRGAGGRGPQAQSMSAPM